MTTPKGKQRSIHMDDETFDTLERLAGEYKANNSTIVRMALIQFDRGGAAGQRTAALVEAVGEVPRTEPANPKHIALPDPKVSSFTVSGGKVRGKVPRNDREDDGLDV